MTEQELRIEFEHEAWCDTQNNISKICNCMMSYPLEIIENLKETIKAKDAEIKHQKELKIIAELLIDSKDKAIAEAREHISLLIVMNDRDYCNGEPYEECENIKKAKVWLEENK